MTNFPASLPTFTDLDGSLTLAANNHATRHNKVHAELAAALAKIGVNGSVDTSSLDYKVSANTTAIASTNSTVSTNATTMNSHIANTSNPHSTTKTQVGLGNVDNTSDATKLTATLQAVYPVGALYFNASVSTNPGTVLGFGTWTAIAGYTLVGFKTSDANFGATGVVAAGEATHVLTTAEMPVHNHGVSDPGHTHTIFGRIEAATGGGGRTVPDPGSANNNTSTAGAGTGISITNTGSGSAHNNIQPSFVVYIWQRTA